MWASGRFWLVLVVYVTVTLLAVRVTPRTLPVAVLPYCLLFGGAIGGAVLKRRHPVISAALARGFFIAFFLCIGWIATHLTLP